MDILCSLSEREIKTYLRKIIFPNGRLHCTHCGYFRVRKIKKENRYYCLRCRKKFSLLSKTWLKNVKISLDKLALLIFCWKEEYTIEHTISLTKLSIPTIRRYFRLFRKNIVKKDTEFKPKNNVQVDEAYFGQFKKQANYYHGFRQYRVVDKTCVAGISCPDTGQLKVMMVKGKPGIPIKKFIRSFVPKDITIYSDGSPIYTDLREDYTHHSQTHDLGFHNAYYIESCWSWMKRKLFKQYHHFTKKYAQEYVSELAWRFNTRNTHKDPLFYLKDTF